MVWEGIPHNSSSFTCRNPNESLDLITVLTWERVVCCKGCAARIHARHQTISVVVCCETLVLCRTAKGSREHESPPLGGLGVVP